FAPILGYGDLVQGKVTINRVYYVEGLNHNLFSVGQFCDADLEVAFRKSTCFVRDLQGNDLLTDNRGLDLYIISPQESTSSTPLCLMSKAIPTQSWLWHRRLSHLNFDYINLLSKKDIVIGLPKLKTKKPKVVPISTRIPKSQANKSVATPHKKKIVQLILFIVDSGCTKHMTGNLKLLCNFVEKFLGTIRFVGQFCDADLEVAFRKSTCFVRDLQGNDLLTGNRGPDLYIISPQESTSSTPLCLMSKATPTQSWLWHRRLSHLNFDYINLLSKKDIVIGLPKLKGTEFLNKTLNAFSKEEGIEHPTSTARTPEQNGVVKR
nr:retrovirus-related Pol polyprotein from transposon TNT 1-94 [Tanacetum cinerariifolium]